MNNDNSVNKVRLTGSVVSEPKFSHELYGERFYEFDLSVGRLSGTKDVLPITASERLFIAPSSIVGTVVTVLGQFRSYNKLLDGKSKLILTVFAQELFVEAQDLPHFNSIELTGFICKPTIYRTTPFNREICDILIAVNRAYGKSDYIPAIAWGRNARFMKFLSVGERIYINGRVQSRIYQKKATDDSFEKHTAYEVSIGKILIDNSSLITASAHDEAQASAIRLKAMR